MLPIRLLYSNLKFAQANLLIFKPVLLGLKHRYTLGVTDPALLQPISIVVSILALTISVVTAWLTLFRRGTVRMTRPTAIYFGADGSVDRSPKVYLRTLLYSTGGWPSRNLARQRMPQGAGPAVI